MNDSVGMVEVTGSSNAIYVLDTMLKAAAVRLLSWETIFGIGRVTVFVEGDVAAVNAAVEAARQNGTCKIFASYIVANPQSETTKFLNRSAIKCNRSI